MGGRFINAFVAGVCSSFMLIAFVTKNSTLFLIEGVIVMLNLMVYFHKDEPKGDE